ncbi:MAG: hypothetical protein HKP27_07250, partial [Myxococcales bacterium]|nr:hypothetical protein [Myxococcales bacterium]
ASLLPAEPDDSHPNLGWDAARGALVGHPVVGVQGALVFDAPGLEVIDAEGASLAQRALEDASFEEALGWLAAMLSRLGIDLPEKGLAPPGYRLPAHGVAKGGRFRFVNAACEELSRWFANASISLDALASDAPGATPLRCWPHHFDLAFLSVRERDDAGAPSKSIGCGLSPGDELVPEPYFYVSPWPYPSPDSLAGLPLGFWHTGDFTAAMFTATELLNGLEATQEARVGEFLAAAYRAGERALSL